MGINSYYFNNIDGSLIDIDNGDFWLSSDNQGQLLNYAANTSDGCAGTFDVITDGLVLWFDVNQTETTIIGESLTSLVEWGGENIETSGITICDEYPSPTDNGYVITPSSGITLCDFGLTGVDNGRYNMLSGITVNITSADTRVVLYPVTGYTVTSANTVATRGIYDYPWTFRVGTTTPDGCIVGDTLCLDGGFYQGYFKLDFEQPNPTEVSVTTQNCGNDVVTEKLVDVDPDATKYDLMPSDFDCGSGNGGWSMETWIKWDNSYCREIRDCLIYDIYPPLKPSGNSLWVYTGCSGAVEYVSVESGTTESVCAKASPVCFSGNCGVVSGTSENCPKILNDDFNNNTGFFFYIGTRAENKFQNVFSGESGLYTCDGIVPLSPDAENPIAIDGQDWFSVSSYGGRSSCCSPCVNSGSTTVTTGTTLEYCDELSENALGFRITPSGQVGYRKMTVTGSCYNNEFRATGTTMEQGYSTDSVIIPGDIWYHITVTYSQNSVKHGLPAGTLRFWVNGRVVYRVENFIGLKLRALNEYSSKQLGVPYNISWGGGTQGLVESQTFGGPDMADRGLQLERYFAGTFLGELSQLRFYDKSLSILEIRNNFFMDTTRYCIVENYGGSVSIIPNYSNCDNCSRGNYTPYNC